jgi:hypothetical protein
MANLREIINSEGLKRIGEVKTIIVGFEDDLETAIGEKAPSDAKTYSKRQSVQHLSIENSGRLAYLVEYLN